MSSDSMHIHNTNRWLRVTVSQINRCFNSMISQLIIKRLPPVRKILSYHFQIHWISTISSIGIFCFFSNQRTHSPNPSSLDIEPVAISEATRPKLNPNQWHDLSSFIFGELILEFVSSYVIGNNPCLISQVSSAVLSFWIKFKFQDQIWVQRRHKLWWLELFRPGNEKEEQ